MADMLSLLRRCVSVSKTFDEQLNWLETLFQRLRRAGLKLKPAKCEFAKTTVKFLGNLLSEEKGSQDPEKVAADSCIAVQSSRSQVRSFLGLTSYSMLQKIHTGLCNVGTTIDGTTERWL